MYLINNIVFDDSEKIKNREIKSNKYKCSKMIISSNFKYSKVKKIFFLVFIMIDLKLFSYFINENKHNNELNKNNFKKFDRYSSNLISNINYQDDFFKLPIVKKQIYDNNLTHIETLYSVSCNVGNALIMLNKLINICEKISCRNIVLGGLGNIIKNPIFYKKNNITIFPYSYKNKITIDISLDWHNLKHFSYKKNHYMRLSIIRDEVLKNIPIYRANANDLYINIRSGDIFLKAIHPGYSQPPLCFYKKIINDNKFNKIFILSNGHENPVVDELLAIYNEIKFIHGSVEFDISIIVNAYNFVMPASTFPQTLISLNYNLKNLYIFGMRHYFQPKVNYTIHQMLPSDRYKKILLNKWKKTKEQIHLMINDNCFHRKMTSYYYKYITK